MAYLDYEGLQRFWEKIKARPTPVNEGGTGASNAANARTNLGLGNIATQNNIDINSNYLTGILATNKGGTGATTGSDALNNWGVDDWIVDQGTTNGWIWRKWNSGRAEAFKQTTSSNFGKTGTINGFYYRNYTQTLPPGVFTSVDYASVDCDWGTGMSWGSVKELSLSGLEAQYISNQDGGAGTFWHEVRGRWK